MLTTTWIWTHEWSLICMRATALTFETCHHAFSCGSAFARSMTRRSFLLPRSGNRMRIPSIASAGVMRVSRTASEETGPSIRCSISGSSGLTARRVSACVSSKGIVAYQRWRRSAGIVEPGDLAPSVGEGLAEPPPVRRLVEPGARARGMGERDHDRVVDDVALADAFGQRPRADDRGCREAADREDQRGAEKAKLLDAPRCTEAPLGGRRRSIAAARDAARVAARDRRAVERRIERLLVELEPRTQRATGPALPRRAGGALDDSRRLPVEIRPSSRCALDDGRDSIEKPAVAQRRHRARSL